MKTQPIGKKMKGAPLAVVFTLIILALFTACSLGGNLDDWYNKAYEEKHGTGDSGKDGSPGNLRVTSTTSSSITLEWNSVSGAAGYVVERSQYSSGQFELAGSSYTTSYTDTSVYSGTTYYYRVCAVDYDSKPGHYSSVVSGTASSGGGGGGSAPGNLRVTSTTSSSITLEWNGNGADKYIVERSEYSSGPFTWTGESYTTSYTDTSVYSGSTYYYRVFTYDNYGAQGPYSSVVSGTASSGGGSLSAPDNLRVTSSTSSSISLAWDSASTAFAVERSESSSGSFSTLVWLNDTTSYTDTSVHSGTTYYYRVCVVYFDGNGPYSNVVSGTASGGGGGGGATPLANGVWANGNISYGVDSVTYSVSVISGTSYFLWWNDAYEGNLTKTLDVKVSARYSGGSILFDGDFGDSAWYDPVSFIANSSGTVLITVEPYHSGNTGTFGIVYHTGSSRPSL